MRKITIISLVIMLMVLSACSGTGGVQNGGPLVQPTVGTQGLVMRVLPESSPSSTTSDAGVMINLEIRNRGADTIEQGAIITGGYERRLLPLADDRGGIFGPLEGKSIYNNEGGLDIIQFFASPQAVSAGMTQYLPGESYTANIQFTAVYPYFTALTKQVCVDPNPYAQTIGEKACTPGVVQVGGGQGAPVAITKIDHLPSKGAVDLIIHVQNAGGGDVFAPGVFGAQVFDFNTKRLYGNKIAYGNVMLGSRPGVCGPAQFISLTNGQGFIKCRFMLENDIQAFQTPLVMDLQYTYVDSYTYPIKITRSS